jgi:hypothetical protein
MQRSDFQGILYFGPVHHGILRGLKWLGQHCKFPVSPVANLEQALKFPGFWLILAVDQLVPNTVPGKVILSGPHLFPHEFPSNTDHVVFNCLAPWVQSMYRHTHPHLATIAAPFPLPYDELVPVTEPKTQIILYSKLRPPNIVDDCHREIQKVFPDVPIVIFKYGQYHYADWLTHLRKAMLVVFVIGTESQGFAVQEAMCLDVPILLFDVQTVNECYCGPKDQSQWFDHEIYSRPIPGTAKNLWDARCGEHITDFQLVSETLAKMKDTLTEYHPRQIILEHLAPEQCLARMVPFQAP